MTASPLVPGNQIQQVSVDGLLTKRMENLSSGQPKYIGEAPPGSGTALPVWRIRMLEYANGENMPPTAEVFADSSNKFEKIWNDRSSFTYK